ncbi:Spaetzle-processing enzyme [Eumeta japonica]|uniref:Spaetzle-processing enzyme n=1 Tax=Eumeta variegata TaxID=151549 RepID=A0A4C1WMC0_EUMVA|nr:Spaetzle-processing enzyme [Eumeta japonica]
MTASGRLKVRLGEYDLINSTDCAESEGRLVCAPAPLSEPVAEALLPASYSAGALSQDLALLRLPRATSTTDFIRPVCLPETGMHLEPNSVLHATGWGELLNSSHSGRYAHIKKNVSLPVWNMTDCKKTYETLHLPDSIICAGGVGADTCRGDSGGPLTVRAGGRAVLVGVTAAGYPRCGTAGFPGLYTSIAHYLPWIRHVLTRPLKPASTSKFISTLKIIYVS